METENASKMRPLSSKRFVVLVQDPVGWRRLFSVQYERVSGDLGYYVHLPYFAHTQGLLRRIPLTVPPGRTEQVDMTVDGLTTTRRLKFTHHPDGEAHFSQDGQVRTMVRAKTKPLSDHSPHLFTVNVWDTTQFQLASPKDFNEPSIRRTSVGFPFSEGTQPPEVAFRIVGYRYPISQIKFHDSFPRDYDLGRPILYTTPQGNVQNGIPICPLDTTDEDFFIMLTYASLDRDKSLAGPSLVFIGGFHHSSSDNPEQPEDAFLAIHYADRKEEWDTLHSLLESIDL